MQLTVTVSCPARIKIAVKLLISASKILLPNGSCVLPATTADLYVDEL